MSARWPSAGVSRLAAPAAPAAPVVLAVMAVLAVLAGCGYQSGSQVDDIPPEELFGLDQTTTTSTTTTTTVPSTTVPPVSSPELSSPTTARDTTTTAVLTQAVELFFLDGSRLISVSQTLSSPTSLSRVLDALERGPPSGDVGFGLRSALPPGIVNTVTRGGGVATVDLVADVYEEIDPEDELPAIAQIVLTLTRQSGVGQVRFTLDRDPLPVRLGNTLVSQPGEAVSADDYANLLIGEDATVGTESTPPSSTPDTSAPGAARRSGAATTTTRSPLPSPDG